MTSPASSPIRNPKARALQGTRAGIVSRLAADGIDYGIVVLIELGVLVGIGVAEFLVTRQNFSVPRPPVVVTVVAQWLIAVLYLTSGWSSTGRTTGKSVLGLRAVGADGGQLSPRRAFLRAVVCCTVGPVLLFWIPLSRRNAGLHDVFLHTAVVYDWRTRA